MSKSSTKGRRAALAPITAEDIDSYVWSLVERGLASQAILGVNKPRKPYNRKRSERKVQP